MDNNFSIFQALSLLSQVGIIMSVSILIAMWIGSKLDDLFGTGIIFLIIFSILGIITGFRSVYKLMINQQNRKG